MSHGILRTPVRFGLVLLLVLAVMVIPVMAGTDNSSVPDATVMDTNFMVNTEAEVPVADFTASTTTGTVPLFVRFTDASTNTPTNWSWDFGDGSTGTGNVTTHTYMSAGTYTVTLNATNAGGSTTATKTGLVTVTAQSGNTGLANSAWPKAYYDHSCQVKARPLLIHTF